MTSTRWPARNAGAKGFWMKWAVASAEDRVIVMIQEVATKPSSTRTKILPRQNGNNRSNIATEP